MNARDRLRKFVPDNYEIEIYPIDGDVASWKISTSRTPIVAIDPLVLERSFEILSDEQLIKFYMDPFFGIVPHEFNETLVTMDLLHGRIDKIQAQYPACKKYVVKRDWDDTKRITDPEERIASIIGQDVQEFEDCVVLATQMVAHRVIIAADPKGYYEWIDEMNALDL